MMDSTSPEIIKEIERIFREKTTLYGNFGFYNSWRYRVDCRYTGSVDRGTEKHIMESLEMRDSELAGRN